MKHIFIAFMALAIGGCTTPSEAKANWWGVCSVERITPNGSTLISYSSGCHISEKAPAEQVSIRRFTLTLPDNSDTYYTTMGMVWFSPDRPDYRQATSGLTRAVFPHETLSACIEAGACKKGNSNE